MTDARLPVVVLLGPTAVGKTATAIAVAQQVNAEIISADSLLFYRGMDIGTAKPSPEEQACVPHHLIDVTDPDVPWTLAVFQDAVRRLIPQIHARGRLPLLVGGTGQYVQAFVEGWEAPRQPPDPALRAALEQWGRTLGAEALHRRLAVLDPEAAARIQPGNLRRTVRALEVIFRTGRRFSAQRRRRPVPYRLLLLGLTRPRPELYARIDARIERMLQAGLLDEVRRLLERYPPDLPPFQAIGYREMIAHLRGEITLEEAIAQMKRRTRQLVRRQANWFRRLEVRWFPVQPDTPAAIAALIRRFLEEAG